MSYEITDHVFSSASSQTYSLKISQAQEIALSLSVLHRVRKGEGRTGLYRREIGVESTENTENWPLHQDSFVQRIKGKIIATTIAIVERASRIKGNPSPQSLEPSLLTFYVLPILSLFFTFLLSLLIY